MSEPDKRFVEPLDSLAEDLVGHFDQGNLVLKLNDLEFGLVVVGLLYLQICQNFLFFALGY